MSGLASWTPHSELFLGGSHWEVILSIPENRVRILLYLKSYRDFLNIKYADVVILKFGTYLL